MTGLVSHRGCIVVVTIMPSCRVPSGHRAPTTRSHERSGCPRDCRCGSTRPSYTGLSPILRQSARRDDRGPLARNGPKHMRWALIEAAAHPARRPACGDRYEPTKHDGRSSLRERRSRRRGPRSPGPRPPCRMGGSATSGPARRRRSRREPGNRPRSRRSRREGCRPGAGR